MRQLLKIILCVLIPAHSIAQEAPHSILVDAIHPTVAPLKETLNSTGSFVALKSVAISSEIPGKIRRLNFVEGEKIKAGTPIVLLNDDVAKAEYEIANARLEKALLIFKRTQALKESGSNTQSQFESDKAELEIAKSHQTLAKAKLGYYRIAAPFTGYAAFTTVSEGEYIVPGETIVQLLKLSPLQIEFHLPQNLGMDLVVGQALEITINEGKTYRSKIEAISPMVDTKNRSFHLKALVDNNKHQLRPGLFANINIIMRNTDKAMWLPENAVAIDQEGHYAFKIVDNKASKIRLKTGVREKGLVEVPNIKQNDLFITGGLNRISDGALVKMDNKQ